MTATLMELVRYRRLLRRHDAAHFERVSSIYLHLYTHATPKSALQLALADGFAAGVPHFSMPPGISIYGELMLLSI